MKAKIRFKVQNDKMAAVMLVGRPSDDYVVTMEEIEEALAEEGIVFGVLTDRIQSAVNNQSFLSEVPCAKGTPPVPGENGELKFAVRTKTDLRPKIRDDGTVDYRDLGLINEIDKGRLICRRTRPIPGKDGTDIYGAPVPFVPGKYPDFPMGDGTEISKFDDICICKLYLGGGFEIEVYPRDILPDNASDSYGFEWLLCAVEVDL